MPCSSPPSNALKTFGKVVKHDDEVEEDWYGTSEVGDLHGQRRIIHHHRRLTNVAGLKKTPLNSAPTAGAELLPTILLLRNVRSFRRLPPT